jgi:hypothetical protein
VRESVRAYFPILTAPLEGVCTWPYLDSRGLVTTGIGDLVDPIELALPLPWHRADGSPAGYGAGGTSGIVTGSGPASGSPTNRS